MSRPKAPESTPASPVPEPRTIATGGMVEYRDRPGHRHDAVILRVYPDGETVDVAYYVDGYPITARGVEHAPEGDGHIWLWPGEAPPPKPTLEQILAAAEARGERTPKEGLTVAYIKDDGDHLFRKLVPYRARVVAVHSQTEIDLDFYLNDVEAFGELDKILDRRRNVRHAVGGNNSWCYLDELPRGLATEFPEVDRNELSPPLACDVCHAKVRRETLTAIGTGPLAKRLCPRCVAILDGRSPPAAPAATS